VLARATTADKLLLVLIFPVAVLVGALHAWEVARSGLAQLPIYAVPSRDGSGYPLVGGYRLETDDRNTVLRPGDRLLRIGDRDLRGVGHLGFDAIGLAAAGPRGEASLTFERDGVRRTAPLPAVPHPYPWSRLPNLLLLPLCALVLLRALGSRDAQRFAAAAATYAIVQLQFYGGPEWRTLSSLTIWNVGTPIAAVLMLRFARLFPAEVPAESRVWWGWPWLAGASYAAVRVNFVTGLPLPADLVQPVSHACHAVFLLGTIMILAGNYVHAYPVGRRRLKWVLLGATLGSLPLMVTQTVPLLAPDWSGFEKAFALGSMATTLWMVGWIVAVIRFNVFDIDRLLGATATFSIVTIGGLAVLLAGVPWLADRGSELIGSDRQTARIGLAMLLAAALVPLSNRLRPRVDALLFPERIALQGGVRELLAELSRCRDPEAVFARTADGVIALLRPRASALYVRENGALVRSRCDGLEVPEVALPGDPLLAAQSSPRTGELDVAVALPIRDAAGIAAVLLLGPKRSGDVYTSTDRSLLDVVASKASGDLLRFAKEASDREARTKSRLLAAASHDIRQPLHALGFMVECLGREVASEDGRALVERIRTSTVDLSAMLGDLLDLSKVDNGAMRVDRRVFALRPLVENLEAEFAPLARRKGLSLHAVSPDVYVESDRTHLLRILRNLLANAVRYTEAGSVSLGLHSRGGRLWIEIADTGPGIPEHRQREIFREFRQLGSGSPGAGLGLAIVEGLARLLGHEIRLQSSPGQGSVFAVAVPQAAPPPPGAQSAHDLRPVLDVLCGRRIVVVEDDPAVREATRLLLARWGCEVRIASDAAGAERLIEPGWTPDFVLSDYHLGACQTGTQVIEQLRRAAGRPLPAALVTGDTAPDQLEEMRASGLPVLQKPLAPARLRAVLTQALSEPAPPGGPPAPAPSRP
jgi:signal transduction histidine kinase